MIISLTGKPCSGKSTIAKILEQKYGFRRIGVGDIFKAEAAKRGMSAEEFNAFCIKDPAYDFFIDKETQRLGKELEGQNIVFDSRLAWHFVPKSFKVFVDLSIEEMTNRLVNSDREGKEKITDARAARASLLNRLKLENERYKQIYGIDCLNMQNYDFVLDSSTKTPEELADKLYEAYIKFLQK